MRHLCAVLLLCAVLFAASCAQNAEGPWVTSWATSLYEPGPAMGEPEALGDRTIRNAVTATVGGKKARRRVSAEEMTAEYAALAGRAHAEGLHILIGTIPPFGAFPIWTQEIEAERQEVNDWIRANSEFDGVADFDAALADPADRTRLAPAFDSGDGLHPNDAGAEAMANAVGLPALFSDGKRCALGY